ncbi:MAG TPA: serine hydrolase, partial [Prolixibacteraceae bacterium]|nr:serine hydrolase [Prolixibacteraceae bacterium]
MINRRAFIKNASLGAASLGLMAPLQGFGSTGNPRPFVLPRSTPEQQGISSSAILKFLEAIKASKQEFHSLMILRHGHVVAEGWWAPYSSEHREQLYSLSKSFTSTA